MVSFDWHDWLNCTDEELAASDIAVCDLACAKGLPGSEALKPEACIARLDEWAKFIALKTMNSMYRFDRDPGDFWNSTAKFRILCMVTFLQLDLGVRYDESQKTIEANFSDSGPQFLHGVLFGNGGTCISLPTLFVAIGRRLGYPLYLAEAKQHYFVRWEERGGEWFNIEATGHGFEPLGDDYFMNGPRKLTESDLQSGRYLRNLTPRQELAKSLFTRACVCQDNFMSQEALQAIYFSRKVDPLDARIERYHCYLTAFGQLLKVRLGERQLEEVVEQFGQNVVEAGERELARICQIHRRKPIRYDFSSPSRLAY